MQHKICTPMFDLVPRCQVLRWPPLLWYGAALSSLAMSVPTILMVSRCPVPHFQSPRSETEWYRLTHMGAHHQIWIDEDAEVTDKGNWSDCRWTDCQSSVDRLDEHHKSSVFSGLSCSRFDRMELILLTRNHQHNFMMANRTEVTITD